jgi:phosphoribosylformimino-5-aminoimidazole carboxamide ribotide isomerase
LRHCIFENTTPLKHCVFENTTPAMPLRVIPVIDLMQGRVVRGIAGERESYRPIQSRLTDSSEPARVAQALVHHFDAVEVYVADLDAITRESPAYDAWQAIAQCGLQLLLDAGIRDLASARETLARGSELAPGCQLVVGLESLRSLDDLRQILALAGPRNMHFSLDLRHGEPLHGDRSLAGWSALEIAQRAIELGVKQMIVLDLASVGAGQGPATLSLCRTLKSRHGHVDLISGGGVRGIDDLKQFEDAGCAGALVASALHDGRLSARQLAAFAARANYPHYR